MEGHRPKGPPLVGTPTPPPGGTGVRGPQEDELRDELQACKRQLRECQHEREDARRRYVSLRNQISVLIIHFGAKDTPEELVEGLKQLLRETPSNG
jgi:hypothetical protein